MLLLTGVTERGTGNQVYVTHSVNDRKEHTIDVLQPLPSSGSLASKLIYSLVLSPRQAAELKAHL